MWVGAVFWQKAATIALSLLFVPDFTVRAPLQSQLDVPYALTHFYPLPQETLQKAYSTGNALLALTELNRVVELAPRSPDAYIARGIAYEKLLRWDDAINDYKRANSLSKPFPFSPDDPTAISNLANAEAGKGLWDLALSDFSKAANMRPDYLAPQIGRALVQFQLEDEEDARQFFSNYPSFADGQAAYAVMMFTPDETLESKANRNAIEHWKEATELDERYLDENWVKDVRRWPPRLVSKYKAVTKAFK